MENQEQVNKDIENEIFTITSEYMTNVNNFETYYVLTQKFPDDRSYMNFFNDAKTNMQKNMANLFQINNIVQKEVDDLQNDTISLNQKIKTQKAEEQKLSDALKTEKGKTKAAVLLNFDFKNEYYRQFINNGTLFLGVLIYFYVILAVYSKTQMPITPIFGIVIGIIIIYIIISILPVTVSAIILSVILFIGASFLAMRRR